jgi:alpha-1,2-rhamnosyltransferase
VTRRIYIDCTETLRVAANTGIQRTVRAILGASLQAGLSEAIPVRFDGTAFVALDASERMALVASARAGWHERARRVAVAALSRGSSPAWLGRARGVASSSYWALRRLRGPAAAAVRYRRGDWLVLLDSTWSADLREELARARGAGCGVCTVIYDLIKLARPDLSSPGAARIFERWLARTLPLSDVIATISRSVAQDVVSHLTATGQGGLASRVRHFPLGADALGEIGGGQVSPAARAALADHDVPTFLAVGSIEARKDQATIVDAFDTLWQQAAEARLVLVGRPGWGSEALRRRLAAHPQLGKRLHWLGEASDADLAYCYRHATALVNMSLCEGFGLPLVEAMHYGLPVIASDIPVFREVAGGNALYVPTGDAAGLARSVRALLDHPTRLSAPAVAATLTWEASMRSLFALLDDQALP